MAALRFFKGTSTPANPIAGMIWFNTTTNAINVYNGTTWEEFCGNVQVKDVKFAENVLTITSREGVATTLDFSDVASAKTTMAVFTKLEKSIDDLNKADSDTNDRIDVLTAGMPTDQQTIVSYVEAEIAKVDTESAAGAVAEELAKEVKRATDKEAELAKAIEDAETAAAEALADAVGEYAAEGVEASGLRKEIAERDAAVLAEAKEYVDGFVGENGTLEKRVADLEAIDHAQVAKDAADAALADAKKYTDDEIAEAVGSYAQGENPATGLRGEIAGVDAKVDALDGRVETLENTVTAEGGLVDKVAALEGLFDGNNGEGVQEMINSSIAALGGEKTGDGTYVDVKVTTKGGQVDSVVVTENFSTITQGIADNAGAIADEKARIDKLVGEDVDTSVRTIAAEEVAKFVEENGNESIDTLKEIAAWIAEHPEDVAAMNEAIQKNASDIKTLNDEVIANEETVAAALTNLDGRVIELEGKNATIDSALQQADITTGSADGTIAVKGVDVAVAGLESAAYVTVESLNTTAQGYATTAKTEAVATVVGDAANDTKDSKTIEGVKKYVDDKVAGKNVEAAGDGYVSATAAGNKVTVETNITAIREAVLTWESFE